LQQAKFANQARKFPNPERFATSFEITDGLGPSDCIIT
jgi:hypothetical protein